MHHHGFVCLNVSKDNHGEVRNVILYVILHQKDHSIQMIIANSQSLDTHILDISLRKNSVSH